MGGRAHPQGGHTEVHLFRMGGCAHARVHVCKQLSRWAGRRACGRVGAHARIPACVQVCMSAGWQTGRRVGRCARVHECLHA